jgi:hypothetical protein
VQHLPLLHGPVSRAGFPAVDWCHGWVSRLGLQESPFASMEQESMFHGHDVPMGLLLLCAGDADA